MNEFDNVWQAESMSYGTVSKQTLPAADQSQKTHSSTICFKCGAKSQNISKCMECKGKGYISDLHPMCALVNEIIRAKLPDLFKNSQIYHHNDAINQDLSIVYDRNVTCEICKSLCNLDLDLYHYSQDYVNYFVCNNCQNSNTDRLLTKVKCNVQKKQNKCFYCTKVLQEICLKCKDCEAKGRVFLICEDCSYSHDHIHNSFQPQLLKNDYNKLMAKSVDSSFDQKQQTQFKQDPIGVRLFLRSENQKRGRASFNIQVKTKGPLNQLEQSTVNIDCSMMASSQMDFEMPIIRHSQSQIIDEPEQEQTLKEKSVIYKCDGCGINPIKSVRYHCNQCIDYDLCSRCFTERGQNHKHCFKIIDFTLTENKVKQSLRKTAQKFLNKHKIRK